MKRYPKSLIKETQNNLADLAETNGDVRMALYLLDELIEQRKVRRATKLLLFFVGIIFAIILTLF